MDLDVINDIRVKLLELMEPVYQVFHDKDSTAADYIDTMLQFLDESMVYEQLEQLKELMEKENQPRLRRNMVRAMRRLLPFLNRQKSCWAKKKWESGSFRIYLTRALMK